jgi:Ion channel
MGRIRREQFWTRRNSILRLRRAIFSLSAPPAWQSLFMEPFLYTLVGIALLGIVLLDAFETIVLPRQVTRRWRLTRLFYTATWKPYVYFACMLRPRSRERVLSFFGPLSLILLLTLWGVLLVLGFASLHFADHTVNAPGTWERLGMTIYYSGTTLFTLGLGDFSPHTPVARLLTVFESFLGFGFLAVVVGYFPVLYQAFSRREVQISLLDARAGTPPSATEFLRRHAGSHAFDEVHDILKDWERWTAEIMESHLSYPVLCFFRSQHDNVSWLSALATVLDASALVLVGIDGACERQARMSFAIARHAIVDLCQVLKQPPRRDYPDRLTDDDRVRLRSVLAEAGVLLHDSEEADRRLAELREMYDPYLYAMSEFLHMELPAWIREGGPDNWQTSAWGRITGASQAPMTAERHLS